MRADLTSSMGMTPLRSPSMGSAKRLYASLISPSFCAETLCSFASLDRGAALDAPVAGAALRFGGCVCDSVSVISFPLLHMDVDIPSCALSAQRLDELAVVTTWVADRQCQ